MNALESLRDLLGPLLDPIVRPGWTATAAAAVLLTVLLTSLVLVVRGGRWWARASLVAAAVLWPLPFHPMQGPVIMPMTYGHGVHLADLLSMIALLALVPRQVWASARRQTANGR